MDSNCSKQEADAVVRRQHRRGTIVVMTAFFLIVMLAMLAFAIDLGYMCVVKTEAQNAADSAALAATWELVGGRRYPARAVTLKYDTVRSAEAYAGYHRVATDQASLQSDEDIMVGYMSDLSSPNASIQYADSLHCNAVQVTVRLLSSRGNQAKYFFAPMLGSREFETSATATAAFADQISGFNVTEDKGPSSLLPFTLLNSDWQNLLQNDGQYSDNYSYDPKTDTMVYGVPDGMPEIKLYPASSGAGNWGTVDIGGSNNSTSDLVRQITEGVNHDDLAYFGGKFELDPVTHTMILDAETGISAGIKSALREIIGEARTIPLYNQAIGTGDTLQYQINGFAGIRVLEVNLEGNDKHLLIQPAIVVDYSAVASKEKENSYFILQPVHLVK